MTTTFDPAKDRANRAKHGLSLADADGFDWTTATVFSDIRFPYPEPRFVAFGMLGQRLHALVYTPTPGGIRAISFRKANRREQRTYANEKA